MIIHNTFIDGLKIIEPRVFSDNRGIFFESYHVKKYSEQNINCIFVQDNESHSSYGTLRGLHFQKGEHAQSKLVRVIEGKILDVAVDLRPGSTSFMKHVSCVLSSENKHQLFIPKGFAHGFVVLSEKAIVSYKCDNLYHVESEGGIIYNDPDLNIDWKINSACVHLSDKDKQWPSLKDIEKDIL